MLFADLKLSGALILARRQLQGLVLLACCLPTYASTYYVANSGNDNNPGTSSSAPWKTLAHVNASSFSPGDSVLLNRGDIWHEQLTPPSSGIAGNQITISAYGMGANPVVSGADTVTSWTAPGGGTPTPSGCTGSCLFASGMETAGFTDWSGAYIPSTDGTAVMQSSSVAHSGSYSAQLKGGGSDNRSGLVKSFSALGSEGVLFFRFFMYVPAGALKANDQFEFFEVPQGSSNLTFFTNDSGNLSGVQFYSTGGSIVPWNTSMPFVMGAWNYVDVAFKVGVADGGGQVWVNGVSVGSNYALNTSASLGLNNVLIGNDSFGHGQVAGGSIYLDDFEIATSGPIGSSVVGSGVSNGGGNSSASGLWTAPVAAQPNVVFVAGNLGVQQYSQSAVTTPGEWYWNQGILYVYSASGAPANVEAAQRDYALSLGQTGSGSYLTVSGIDFRIANQDAVHIVNTSGDVVNGGLITGAYQYGLLAIGVYGGSISHLLVSNNTVSMNGSSGIEISSGHSYATVQNNVVFGNAFNPSSSGDFIEIGGIKFLGVSGVPVYDLAQYNVSDHNGVFGGNESQGSGIWFDKIADATMQYNVAFNNASHGLYFEKAINCLMYGNDAYSNGVAQNTANIASYTSEGFSSAGNTLQSNMAWSSMNWGMKLGAYQGVGASQVYNNTYEGNTVVNSASIDLYADTGADNDGVNGYGNVFSGNAFGLPATNWLYWVTYGFVSNYAELDTAYGSSTNSNQANFTVPVGAQQPCTGSCLFTSGMESLSDFASVYQPAGDGTKVAQTGGLSNSGTYALQMTGGGSDNRGGVTAAFPAIGSNAARYFRFYVNIPAGSLKGNDQFQILQLGSGVAAVSFGTDANGNVTSLGFTSSGGTILGATPVSFPMGSWNYLDVAFTAAGNGGGQVWVNGTSVGSNYGVNTGGAAGTSTVTLGNMSNGHGQVAGGNIYLDDFRIGTSGPIGVATVALPVQN